MSNSVEELLSGLQDACRDRDWDRLAELDSQLRSLIERFVGMAKTEEQKSKLASWLKNIQRIYDLMREDSEKHRDEIALELKKLSRDKKAVNSYLDSASY